MKRWPLHIAYFWDTAPFFRLLLPFVAGIAAYEFLWPPVNAQYLLAFMAVALAVCIGIIYSRKNTGAYRTVTFALLSGILCCAGMVIYHLSDVRNDKNWFGNSVHTDGIYLTRISATPVEKERTWKIPVDVVLLVTEQGNANAAIGKAFIYVYKSKFPMQLRKGDSIVLPGKWQAINNAGNPFEFDYATYCRRNNIGFRQFVSMRDIRLYGAADPASSSLTDRAHAWCMAQLDTYLPDHKTKGLLQAMLLGDEVNLDEDLRQSFSETGIVHIIAISGGNVAIFFIVISFLLWWMKHKKLAWVKFAIALPLVWFYVLMAGAAPSAIRAAMMFSLLAVGVMLQKNNNSLNQLFATAFLLLCAQPAWLFSIGFQLSFVAVLSLILFYTPVYKWSSPANKIARVLWGTVAASIAAEVLVAPLVIYYFHMFPLLFVVANVAAYVFMSIVLVAGIAIIVLSFVPVIATWIGLATMWLVGMFGTIVGWLQTLNPPSFHFLLLNGLELVLVYTVIGGVLVFMMRKQKPALFTGLTAACVLMLSLCRNEWLRLHRQQLVVYNCGKLNHVELIKDGGYSVLYSDTLDEKKLAYITKPAHINWMAWQQKDSTRKEVFKVGDKTVLILHDGISGEDQFPVDCVVLAGRRTPDPMTLKKVFSPSVVVLGGGYGGKKRELFMKKCAEAGIAVHSVKDGGFVL